MTIGVSNYPNSLDTVTELIQAVNRTSSLLASSINDSVTTITVDDASVAPGSGMAWIDNEAISYTGKAGNQLTGCIRGFDNTVAAEHGNGAIVYFDVISAAHHNVLASAIIALETYTLNTVLGGTVSAPVTIQALTSPLILERYVATSNGASIVGRKSRGATLNSHAIVVDGDVLSQWEGWGSDGSQFALGARIRQRVNGSPSAGIVPGKIDFETATTAGVLTTRMTIFNNGKIQMYGETGPQLEVQNTGANPNVLIWLNNTSTGYAEFTTDWWGFGEATDANGEDFYLWNYNTSETVFSIDKVTSKTSFFKTLAVSTTDDPQLDVVSPSGASRIRVQRGDNAFSASITLHDWDVGENGSEEFYVWNAVSSRYEFLINQSTGKWSIRGPEVVLGSASVDANHILALDSPTNRQTYIDFRDGGTTKWIIGKSASADTFFIQSGDLSVDTLTIATTGMTFIWEGLTLADPTDNTKRLTFDASTVPTGTTITVSAPDVSGQLALISNVQVTLGPFFINDKAAGTTDEMALAYFNTGTALNLGTTGASSENDLRMPVAGRVVAMFLNTDTARTGGSVTGRLRINNVDTGFASGACVLNSTDTIRASAFDATGPAFAAGDRVGMGVAATAGWTPTSANLTGFIVVRFNA